jgi:hypothetical protein
MKRRYDAFHGCPEDTQFFRCIAYNKNGRLCKEPATTLDPSRGGYICEQHAAEMLEALRAEASAKEAA